jgi:hypothetical protein
VVHSDRTASSHHEKKPPPRKRPITPHRFIKHPKHLHRRHAVDTNVIKVNQIKRNLQISTYLETLRDSQRALQISTDLVNGHRIKYYGKPLHAASTTSQPDRFTIIATTPQHHITTSNHHPMSPQHLTTPSPHHLRLRSVTAITTTLIPDPTQPPITSMSQSPHPSQVPRNHPSPIRHNHRKRKKNTKSPKIVSKEKHTKSPPCLLLI